MLLENAARLSIPYLVKEGIDRGIPPIQATGDTSHAVHGRGARVRGDVVQAVTGGPSW